MEMSWRTRKVASGECFVMCPHQADLADEVVPLSHSTRPHPPEMRSTRASEGHITVDISVRVTRGLVVEPLWYRLRGFHLIHEPRQGQDPG